MPIPRVDETRDTLAGSQWLSTVDLISETEKEKTAFCVPDGLFQFNVMPFRLCNAPATFQYLMDAVLGGLQWDQCLVYLDDIIVLGRSFESHLKALSEVLGHLERAGLKLMPAKCHLCCKKVSYPGHIVTENQIAGDPSKAERIAAWPIQRALVRCNSSWDWQTTSAVLFKTWSGLCTESEKEDSFDRCQTMSMLFVN